MVAPKTLYLTSAFASKKFVDRSFALIFVEKLPWRFSHVETRVHETFHEDK